MFVVLLRYTRPLVEIDALMHEHVSFLEECYRAGVRRFGTPAAADGGVILAVAPQRADVETVMQHDPFVREGLADYEVIEFRTSLHHRDFARFADAGTRPVRDVPDPGHS